MLVAFLSTTSSGLMTYRLVAFTFGRLGCSVAACVMHSDGRWFLVDKEGVTELVYTFGGIEQFCFLSTCVQTVFYVRTMQ